MKALLIILFVSLTRGDKLNSAYLPPPGANNSGGDGDIEVPFEVPVVNFGVKDESTKLTPGIFRNGGITSSTYAPNSDGKLVSSTYANGRLPSSTYAPASNGKTSLGYKPTSSGRIIPYTFAPNTYPSTTSKYNSYTTTPGAYKQSFGQVTDGSLNRPSDGTAFSPNQYTENRNNGANSLLPSENQFENNDENFEQFVSFGPTKDINNNGGKKLLTNNKGFNTIRYPERKIRPQEETDRNAIILNYENVITPDGFAYSFDTSNGIHADESGTASDGVKAEGSYSYIGDDGKQYNVTYSADEYGFRPRGDHLPTPPPIPDAILKVIEQAAKDENNGVFDNGLYDENKYGFRKYQPAPDRTLGQNNPRLESLTIHNNGASYKKPSNISDGSTNYEPNRRVSSDFPSDYGNIENQKGNNFIEFDNFNNQNPNEARGYKKGFSRQGPQKYSNSDTVKIPGNKIYNSNEPRDDTNNSEQSNRNNYDTGRILSGPEGNSVTYDRKHNFYDSDIKTTPVNSQNGYSYPNPDKDSSQGPTQNLTDFGTSKPTSYNTPLTERIKEFGKYSDKPSEYFKGFEQDSTDRFKNFNTPTSTEKLRDFTTLDNRPSDYFQQTVTINNPASNSYYNPTTIKSVKEFNTYTDRPNNYYIPSQELGKFDTANGRYSNDYGPSNDKYNNSTNRQKAYYNPSSTQSINEFDKVTGKPNEYNYSSSDDRTQYGTYTEPRQDFKSPAITEKYFSPSFSEKIKPTGSFTRPTDYYSPTSTDSMKSGAYTVQPTGYNYYRPAPTKTMFEYKTGTVKPSDYYNSASQGRIKPNGNKQTFTVRPTDYYGPSSTEGIEDFGTATGRPTSYYGPSTERINDFGSITGRPIGYYGPTSTEEIKDFSVATGRPTNYYGPAATERIKDFGIATSRPTDYLSPLSTERIKDFGSSTGQPTNYSPLPTKGIDIFGISTSRPTNYNGPASTERIKYFETATDQPSGYYGPSSTEGIKDFDTATGRPTDYYRPSSTQSIKDFGAATGKPIDYYHPSTTQRIKEFDAATGQPIDYYGPSSTQRIKDFGAASGRLTNYYGPSTTERMKELGTASDGPTAYYKPSSSERAREDFSGPKQPQRYDPETGYHY